MSIEKKRGRPRLDITDAERVRRQKDMAKKYVKGKRQLNVTGAVAKRFDAAKKDQEKVLGFSLTLQQFMTILLTRWEKDTINMTENCNTGEHVRDSLTSTDDLSTTKLN